MRKFCKLILVLVMIGCISCSVHIFITNANNGTNCSTGGIITEQARQFILDTFGNTDSPEELANCILRFALENFTYDESYTSLPQTADTNRFIFKNDFHGVCMDFSAFVKSVFQVVGQDNGWEHVGCHIVLGHDLRQREGHAVNYLTVRSADGTVRIYEFDVTQDLTRHSKGKPVQGIGYSVVVSSPETVPQTIRKAFSDFYKYPYLVIT